MARQRPGLLPHEKIAALQARAKEQAKIEARRKYWAKQREEKAAKKAAARRQFLMSVKKSADGKLTRANASMMGQAKKYRAAAAALAADAKRRQAEKAARDKVAKDAKARADEQAAINFHRQELIAAGWEVTKKGKKPKTPSPYGN